MHGIRYGVLPSSAAARSCSACKAAQASGKATSPMLCVSAPNSSNSGASVRFSEPMIELFKARVETVCETQKLKPPVWPIRVRTFEIRWFREAPCIQERSRHRDSLLRLCSDTVCVGARKLCQLRW